MECWFSGLWPSVEVAFKLNVVLASLQGGYCYSCSAAAGPHFLETRNQLQKTSHATKGKCPSIAQPPAGVKSCCKLLAYWRLLGFLLGLDNGDVGRRIDLCTARANRTYLSHKIRCPLKRRALEANGVYEYLGTYLGTSYSLYCSTGTLLCLSESFQQPEQDVSIHPLWA
jgi:hypothetical protein